MHVDFCQTLNKRQNNPYVISAKDKDKNKNKSQTVERQNLATISSCQLFSARIDFIQWWCTSPNCMICDIPWGSVFDWGLVVIPIRSYVDVSPEKHWNYDIQASKSPYYRHIMCARWTGRIHWLALKLYRKSSHAPRGVFLKATQNRKSLEVLNQNFFRIYNGQQNQRTKRFQSWGFFSGLFLGVTLRRHIYLYRRWYITIVCILDWLNNYLTFFFLKLLSFRQLFRRL